MVDRRETTVEEITRTSLERIERLNSRLNAVVAVRADAALAEAQARDRLPPGDRGLLHGVPFTIKDVTETIDLPTTYGSIAFKGHRTDFDAVVVARLRQAGGILVGKTNTPELACEPVTRGQLFGDTLNPWAPERTPGGSSGGAAAGLAAGMFTLAQGTDAGGSIRIPASCCGVVGLKPTRGRVTFAPAAYEPWGGLLHNGPITRDVRDAALMLDAMADPWPEMGERGDFRAACERPVRRLRVAYLDGPRAVDLDAEVANAFADALAVMDKLGMELVPGAPSFSSVVEPFAPIAEVAFAAMAAEMTDEQLGLIGLTSMQLITRGREIGAAQYYAALQTAHRESARVLRFWEQHDVLLTPTVPWVPPLRERFPASEEYDQKWTEYGAWEMFTSPFNVTGQPAISLPCRVRSSTGAPIGVQLVGRLGGEADLLTLSAAYEAAVDWTPHPPESVLLDAGSP
jgi:amidase/aspartyl-tRNA(Asn)/glutamyl-tRNA(Gln) amidotransferase subunit A